MRIVDRDAFLALPPGTVFAKYEPCLFGDLAIKGGTCGANDFFFQQIVDSVNAESSVEAFEQLEASREHGARVGLDFQTETRDGSFDDGQLFAVWDDEDVRALVARLQQTLPA